jgi:hypothetical protein
MVGSSFDAILGVTKTRRHDDATTGREVDVDPHAA